MPMRVVLKPGQYRRRRLKLATGVAAHHARALLHCVLGDRQVRILVLDDRP